MDFAEKLGRIACITIDVHRGSNDVELGVTLRSCAGHVETLLQQFWCARSDGERTLAQCAHNSEAGR
jgi:hypothetical protein